MSKGVKKCFNLQNKIKPHYTNNSIMPLVLLYGNASIKGVCSFSILSGLIFPPFSTNRLISFYELF
jgi:hypothetical protein